MTVIFRLPRSAYVAVLFFSLGLVTLMQRPALVSLFLVPILMVLVIARRSTVVDDRQIVVRTGFASAAIRIPWADVCGFITDKYSRLAVVRTDGGIVKMPYVRVRSLDILAKASGGVVPVIPPQRATETDGTVAPT